MIPVDTRTQEFNSVISPVVPDFFDLNRQADSDEWDKYYADFTSNYVPDNFDHEHL